MTTLWPSAWSAAAGPSSSVYGRLAARAGVGERYRLEGEIARGGMGVILRGFDTDLGRDVAIKLPHPHRASEATYLAEACIVAGLDHPVDARPVPVRDTRGRARRRGRGGRPP